MSLLGFIGSSLSQGASGFIAKALGSSNRSLQGDCLDISDVGSYAAKLAKYPQCAPYINAAGPVTTMSPVLAAPPTIGMMPPVVMPGGSPIIPPYTPQVAPTLPPAQQLSGGQAALPISYATPVGAGGGTTMTPFGLPMIPPTQIPGLPGSWSTGGSMMGIPLGNRTGLPWVRRALAKRSGLIISRGFAFTPQGALVGRVRRRRRLNPLNYRAALRAAARLYQVKDMTARIEKAIGGTRPRRARRARRKKSCR